MRRKSVAANRKREAERQWREGNLGVPGYEYSMHPRISRKIVQFLYYQFYCTKIFSTSLTRSLLPVYYCEYFRHFHLYNICLSCDRPTFLLALPSLTISTISCVSRISASLTQYGWNAFVTLLIQLPVLSPSISPYLSCIQVPLISFTCINSWLFPQGYQIKNSDCSAPNSRG